MKRRSSRFSKPAVAWPLAARAQVETIRRVSASRHGYLAMLKRETA
jgi:hypothetical protein